MLFWCSVCIFSCCKAIAVCVACWIVLCSLVHGYILTLFQMLFVITKPDVFKSPNSDTYIIFGEVSRSPHSNTIHIYAHYTL